MFIKSDTPTLTLVSLLLVATFATIGNAQTVAIDKVIAMVNNAPILLSEYRAYYRQERLARAELPEFNQQINRQLLDSMIDQKLQLRQADIRGIEVSENEVDSAIQLVGKQNNISVEQLASQLAKDNFTDQQFRDSIREQQKLRKLIDVVANAQVVVSEQEIENYINNHQELLTSDDAYEVSHLFIQTKNKSQQAIENETENADYVRNLIQQGEDFASVAEKFSDADDKDEGGYLGWRTAQQLPEMFVHTLRNLSPDGDNISEVLPSENGLHILKLHARKGSGKLVEQQLIRHILIQPDEQNTVEESLAIADDLYNQLQNGESFEKLARLFSADAQSKTNGGSLGWVTLGVLVPEFDQAAIALPLNTISKPLRSRFGYHLIEVLDRRETDMSNEIASNRAREAIFRRKADELYSNWFQFIRERAFIEYID